MDRFDAMRMFVRVVQSGSFSATAREAGVGQPFVSKQIAQLEARLSAQLLRRTSRSMTLTEAGQSFYEAAIRLINDLEAAESLVGRGQTAPSGLVRVTVAPVFGRLFLVPKLPEFLARMHHPNGRFLTADAEQIRAAVLANLGLAHIPGWLFAHEIASGAVRRVLVGNEPAPLSISAVHPADRRVPTKVRVFTEFVVEALRSQPGFTLAKSRPV